MVWIELAALGTLIGLLSSFLGLGGGVVIVPALVWLGLGQQSAAATALMAMLLIAFLNVRAFHRRGMIPWSSVSWLVAGSGVAAFFSAQVASNTEEWVVKVVFAVVLLGLLALTLVKKSSGVLAAAPARGWWKFLTLGGFAGAISGATGVGGGAVAGPLLLRFRMTSGAHLVPVVSVMLLFTSAMGVAGYILSQPVRWDYALALFLASQLTAPLGHRYQHKVKERTRYRILVSILLLITFRVWWDLYVHIAKN